jgi:hypothetical protein
LQLNIGALPDRKFLENVKKALKRAKLNHMARLVPLVTLGLALLALFEAAARLRVN